MICFIYTKLRLHIVQQILLPSRQIYDWLIKCHYHIAYFIRGLHWKWYKVSDFYYFDNFTCVVLLSELINLQAQLGNTQNFSRNTMTKCIYNLLLFSKFSRFLLNNTNILLYRHISLVLQSVCLLKLKLLMIWHRLVQEHSSGEDALADRLMTFLNSASCL